jgi:gliding motility-associated-like protein
MDYTLVNQTCQDDGTGSLEVFPSGGNPPYTIYVNDVEMTSNPTMGFIPGKYEIRIVDSQNCTRSDSIESFTLVALNPQISADPVTGFTPLTVNFDFTADSAASWVWHFSETESDTNKSTSFTFTEYGNHEVILGVNSGPPYYCTETTTVNIFVDIIVTIEANSVFTPNADGHNDFFEVKTVGVKDLEVNIYNQWGNKVYEFNEIDGKWDGNTSTGAESPDGTYFYSLTATGVNDLIYNKKGSVLLLRHGAAAYPNPVTDRVTLETYETLQPPVYISVYSIFGQLSYSEIVDDPGYMHLDLSGLPGGIYIIKASDGARDCYARIIKK